MAKPPGEIVWARRVDKEKHRRHLRLFWMIYGIPAGLAILAGGLFQGLGGAAGVAILLGGLGAMIFFAIWLTGKSKEMNPEITLEGSELCWATRRVALDQVRRFSTFMEEASMTMVGITGSHTNATAQIGTAKFLLLDGSEVDFKFAHLDQAQLEELRSALERVLPGKRTPLSELHKPV